MQVKESYIGRYVSNLCKIVIMYGWWVDIHSKMNDCP